MATTRIPLRTQWPILWDRFGLMPESALSRLARSTELSKTESRSA